MNIYPNYYCKDVTKITVDYLKQNDIKGLILDIDNTLIDIDKKMLGGVEKWHEEIVLAGIKTIILSNSNKEEKVSSVAKKLNIDYINFAQKPLKKGFLKAQEKLSMPAKNIAAVGDQIFTDVIGANRCNMFSILVEQVDERDFWYTKWKRPIEKLIINKYLKTLEK
jgi:hypothetical protein